MRLFLAIVGAIALVFIAAIAGLFFYIFQQEDRLTKEAAGYADEAIPAITTNWDANALLDRADPELLKLLGNGALDNLMLSGTTQIGALTDYHGAECEIVHYELNTSAGEVVLSTCNASAAFQKSDAKIRLSLRKMNKEWKILGFFVETLPSPKPVEVSENIAAQAPLSKIEFSFRYRSVAITGDEPAAIGIGWASGDKVENAF